jgi:hypothetical protein
LSQDGSQARLAGRLGLIKARAAVPQAVAAEADNELRHFAVHLIAYQIQLN